MAKRRYWRDIVGVFNSNVFSIIFGLLISIILTRELGPEKFGILTALQIIPVIIVSLTHLGIRGSSVYHIGKKIYKEDELISSILNLLILSSAAGIIISIIAFLVYNNENFTVPLIALVLLTIPVRLAITYIGGIYLGKDEIRKANNLNWTTNFLNLILAVLFVWWFKWSVLGAVLAILVSSGIIGIRAIWQICREYHINLKFRPEILKSLLKLGILFSVSFFIIQLNFRIDVLLMQQLSTNAEVGIYSLGVTIAEQLWQLPLAMSIIVFSRTAIAGNSPEMNIVTTRLMRISLLITFVVSIAIFFLSPVLVPLFFGEKFIPSIPVIQTLLPGVLLMVLFRILSGQIAGIGRPEVTIYVFAPALIINIILNLFLIPVYGAVGAALASDISYSLGAVAYLIAYSRIVKMPVREIFRFSRSDFNIIGEIIERLRNKWKS